jgi:hypothetical protein
MGPNRPLFLVTGYYSVHPRKGRVVLSQLPHVLWASDCWHYERTLYSRRPLKRDRSFYLSRSIFKGPLSSIPPSEIDQSDGQEKCS